MSKEEYPEMQLLDAIDLTATIACTKCDKEDETSTFDMDGAMKVFYEDGWRATDSHTYCPKCVKKYLKKKK